MLYRSYQGVYFALIKVRGKQIKRSLDTKDLALAKRLLRIIPLTLWCEYPRRARERLSYRGSGETSTRFSHARAAARSGVSRKAQDTL